MFVRNQARKLTDTIDLIGLENILFVSVFTTNLFVITGITISKTLTLHIICNILIFFLNN